MSASDTLRQSIARAAREDAHRSNWERYNAEMRRHPEERSCSRAIAALERYHVEIGLIEAAYRAAIKNDSTS